LQDTNNMFLPYHFGKCCGTVFTIKSLMRHSKKEV